MGTVARRLRGRYSMYVLLYFFLYFSMSSYSSVLSVYLTGLGKTATEMSFIVSSANLFSLPIVPLTGILCDRTGRHRLINCIQLVLMALFAVAFACTRQVWALFVLNGLVMSMMNAVMPVSERLATSGKFRYGVLRIWGTFGYAAGAQAAALLIQHFSGWVLFALVGLTALVAVAGYLGTEEPLPDEKEGGPGPKVPLSSFLREPRFLLYLVIMLFLYGCSGANMSYAPLLLRSLGVSTGAVGSVLFFSTLAEIPLILFSHRFMDRFSGKALLLTASGIALIQYLCYALLPWAWAVILAMVLLKAIASTLFMMIILKIVRNLIRPELTTTGISIVNTVNSLGSILMQNISGPLADAAGVRSVFLLFSGLTALGAGLTLFLRVDNSRRVFG